MWPRRLNGIAQLLASLEKSKGILEKSNGHPYKNLREFLKQPKGNPSETQGGILCEI